MTVRYMLDTNICIDVINERPGKLIQKFERHAEQLCMSSITLAELLYGAEKSSRRLASLETVANFSSRLQVLSFGSDAAAHYGQIRAELETGGTPIGPYDMLIAAHARSDGLIVVTRNRREFDRIPGLRVESWL
jgi:tRNA(fMet)-specific endonuclease VapC